MFIDAEHRFQDRSGDRTADRDAGCLKKIQISELKPPDLNKRPHTMRYLAKVKNTPIVQPIADPPSETGLGFGRVHAADGGVLPAADYFNSAEDDPEGPFNSVGVYHFICLTGIGCV